VTIAAVACSYTETLPTGIEEVQLDPTGPVRSYRDLMGNRIEKPSAGLFIEVAGSRHRKMYIVE
jgi:hypothetical protein